LMAISQALAALTYITYTCSLLLPIFRFIFGS